MYLLYLYAGGCTEQRRNIYDVNNSLIKVSARRPERVEKWLPYNNTISWINILLPPRICVGKFSSCAEPPIKKSKSLLFTARCMQPSFLLRRDFNPCGMELHIFPCCARTRGTQRQSLFRFYDVLKDTPKMNCAENVFLSSRLSVHIAGITLEHHNSEIISRFLESFVTLCSQLIVILYIAKHILICPQGSCKCEHHTSKAPAKFPHFFIYSTETSLTTITV